MVGRCGAGSFSPQYQDSPLQKRLRKTACIVALCPGLVLSTLTAIHCPNANGGLIRTRVMRSGLHVSKRGMSFSLVFRGPASPFVGSVLGDTRTTVGLTTNTSMRIGVSIGAVRRTHPRIRGLLPAIGGVVTISDNGNNINGDAITTGLTITLTGLNCGIKLLSTSVFNPSVPGVFRIRSTHPCTRHVRKHSLVVPVRDCNIGILSVNFFISPGRTAV